MNNQISKRQLFASKHHVTGGQFTDKMARTTAASIVHSCTRENILGGAT